MPRNSIQITSKQMPNCFTRFYYPHILLLTWICAFLVPALGRAQAVPRPAPHPVNFIVTVDAGHGGKDPGALGKKSREKDIVLSIARKFGQMVESQMPDVKVVYTRKTDVFIPLDERAAIANRNKSDLFVSIHANANNNKGLFGSETYVMGLSKSSGNMDVVMQENQVMMLEDDYETKYEGFDPTSPTSYIKFNLLQNDNLNQSLEFATYVQENFRTKAKRVDRGVRQGPFWVLWRTAMPSVIVETGYISNKTEEEYLITEDGQEELASAIFEAFRNYKKELDLRKSEKSEVTVSTSQTEALKNPDPPLSDTAPVVSATAKNEKTKPEMVKSGTEFRVQVLSSVSKIPPRSGEFKGMTGFTEFRMDGRYKYLSAPVSNYENALKLRKELAVKFPGAFIVPFRDGVRITLNEAVGGKE